MEIQGELVEASWKNAIKRVLAESPTMTMHYTEISEQILSRGYYETEGATPAATVNAQLAHSLKADGEKTPFMRVGRGIWALKMAPNAPELAQATKAKQVVAKTETLSEIDVESSESIIHSFGMYWQRDQVVWRSDPVMIGKEQALSKPIDFGKQKGIYILYDHHTVIYVGRAIDRPLGKRLNEHTVDRLGSRWNRFSWFGLLDVTQEGNLRELEVKASLASLVSTLEALLIEALEPPQNRKRGDDFSAMEYIQGVDPELEEREIKKSLRAIEQKMRS